MILLFICYLVLQSSAVQTYLARQLTGYLSDRTGTIISIGRVEITFFSDINLYDVYVEDQRNDTLLYIPEANAEINSFSLEDKNIDISKITISESAINIFRNKENKLNFQFIIDSLMSKEEEPEQQASWNFTVDELVIKNSRLSYKTFDSKPKDELINFKDIALTEFGVTLSDFYIIDSITHIQINRLEFREKSGFILGTMKAGAEISNKEIYLSSMLLVTPNSSIDADSLKLNYKSMADFNDFIKKVKISSNFGPSTLGLRDIGYFAGDFRKYNEKVRFSGQVNGKIKDIRTKNFHLEAGESTIFKGKLTLTGLPNPDETFIIAEIDELQTNKEDLELFYKPGDSGGKDYLMPELTSLGKIKYRGNITGLLNDFVAYGTFTTNLGTITCDASLKRESKTGRLIYNGKVITNDFHLGKFLYMEKDLGIIAVNTNIKGSSGNGKTTAKLDGNINSIEYKGYNYKNIEINGELVEKKFEGRFSINDDNLDLAFRGKMDFNGKVPEFDIVASINDAQLYNLNIDLSDKSSTLTSIVKANFTGSNPDNIAGSIRLSGTSLTNSSGIFYADSINLIASSDGKERKLSLESDFADGEITGNYTIKSLENSVAYFIKEYLPSYLSSTEREIVQQQNEFNFVFRFKNLNGLLSLLKNNYYLEPNSSISGYYNSVSGIISIKGKSKLITYDDFNLNNFLVSANTIDSILSFSTECQSVYYKKFHLDDIIFKSRIKNDSVDYKLTWLTQDTVTYSGDIKGTAIIASNPFNNKPVFRIGSAPSSFVIADTVWHINDCHLSIDSTSIAVSNLVINNNYQRIFAQGTVSEIKQDTLNIVFNALNLKNLNQITQEYGIKASGIMNGKASLSNIYNQALFTSDLNIDNLVINDETFGNTYVKSKWMPEKTNLYCEAYTLKNKNKEFDASGYYTPENGKLDFDIRVKDFNLAILEPYLKENLSDIEGLSTGRVFLKGDISEPAINGYLNILGATFTVNYLQTRYKVKDSRIDITKDSVYLKKVILEDYDKQGNHADVNGWLSHHNFKDFKFNVLMNAKNFMFLNTTAKDNSLYYGKAFATGVVGIKGNPENIKIDISAKSEKNTRLFIPLNSTGEISEYDFITFVDKSGLAVNKAEDYKVNLSGIEMNFDLEVTPDAEMQIIFDSKAGDIMKGRGSGNLKMEINTLGTFSMYGDYVIEEGDYLFTLENVINKKFKVEKGGVIKWNGDPYDAYMEINAIYRTKAKPYDLFVNLIDSAQATAYRQRIPVDCNLLMTGSLMAPSIKFDITMPTANDDTQEKLKMVLNSDEIINKQILALLVLNRFLANNPDGVASTNSNGALGSNSSELLSNQLSHWLSQISNDFDIGVNYRPGDEISSDEVEVALSTQIFNDRVSINSNLGVGGNHENTNGFGGDFVIDWKINNSGKLRAKGYTKTNDNLVYDSPTTQGIGLFYREEFDSWGQLIRKYWFGKKPEETKETIEE